MIMNLKYSILFTLFVSLLLCASCSDDDPATALGNDCIKRSISPNIVGGEIEFAYAMAIPPGIGKLTSVEVSATIPGAKGTYLDPKSYRTNASGQDVGVVVAESSRLQDGKCITSFIVDTCATTLRYFYEIPEEARGKEVSFSFSVKASNGEKQQYNMGPYKISKMDMVKNLELKHIETCYISLKDLKIYTAAEAAANAGNIDVIYGFSSKSTIGHAFYAPTASAEYLDETIVPSGASSDSKLVKTWALRDQQLSDLQWAIFIDDQDFQECSFDNAANFYLGLKAENGVWVETGDKKIRAYIYINSITNGQMIISIKRYIV